MMNEVVWAQKYRPTTIEECILPDSTKNVFQGFVDSNTIPNLLCSSVTPGTGKTTAVLALANQTGYDTMMINASLDNGIDTVRNQIIQFSSSISFSGNRKLIILDEADQLSLNAQTALRGTMEQFSNNVSFALTCNTVQKIIEPIRSRCANIEFSINQSERAKVAKLFLNRCFEILNLEGVEYDKKVVAELVKRYFPDFRRTINEIQRLSSGRIDAGSLSNISNSLSLLVTAIKSSNFRDARTFVGENDIDYGPIYSDLYNALREVVVPESIPALIILLDDYQATQAMCANPEIHLLACIIKIMSECKFR